MLVFSRKKNQQVIIPLDVQTLESLLAKAKAGQEIEIAVNVCHIAKSNVKIGITCDTDIPAHRENIMDRIRQETAA